MLTRILPVVFISLFTNCVQPQPNHTQAAEVQPDSAIVGISRAEVVAFAETYLGTPYRYAGTDPTRGFDCSGFVYFVFKNFNIDVPRGSSAYILLGTPLKPDDFKIGDVLVFYGYIDSSNIGHVGIICEANGMKSRFIHSSSGKAYGVTISELGSGMYSRRFYKCIDVIGL